MAFCENLECWQLSDASSKLCKDHQGARRLDLSGLGNVQLNNRTAPSDFSKAVALTQTAINNLGQPIHASMIDHKPVDVALAQALTQTKILKQGEKYVDSEKLPHDRALSEALTFTAISHQPQDKLKQTGRRSSLETSGLTTDQQGALLDEAKAEKDRKAAAKVFGGGDSKEAMASILGEINNQGIVSVPSDKVPDENITLNQIKTLAQINALQEGGAHLTHTEQPVDHSIVQARTLKALASESAKANLKHTETNAVDAPLAHSKVVYAIDHLGEPNLKHEEHGRTTDPSLAHGQTLYAIGHHQRKQSLPSDKVYADKALAEALTLNALGSEAPKAHLKPVDHPQEGLTQENLAALQAAAQQEKNEDDSEPTPVFHMPASTSE